MLNFLSTTVYVGLLTLGVSVFAALITGWVRNVKVSREVSRTLRRIRFIFAGFYAGAFVCGAILLILQSQWLVAEPFGDRHGWWLTLIGGGLGAWWLPRRARRQEEKRERFERGLCVECGYDIRSTPDQDSPRLSRCPECGVETGYDDPSTLEAVVIEDSEVVETSLPPSNDVVEKNS